MADNEMFQLDGRQTLLMGVAIHEWIQAEKNRQPESSQRSSDCEDLQIVLDKFFPHVVAMIQAREKFDKAN